MKITYQKFDSSVKTKSEPSSLIENLWISRSAITMIIDGQMQPMLGFSAGFDRNKCEIGSKYELLEHLAFLPYAYDEKSLCDPVIYLSEILEPLEVKGSIKQFLVGSPGTIRPFYGNGCAIFNGMNEAVLHSRRELIERHLCCEIWYKRSLQLIPDQSYQIKTLIPSVKIKLYTVNMAMTDKFAIATLECCKTDFFAIGAAVKSNLNDAYEHAVSEVGMIFEDFIKKRDGNHLKNTSQKNILSLRQSEISSKRKKYFDELKLNILKQNNILPLYQSIVFEPLPEIYAARTFSCSALDPRLFETQTDLPILPLF